MSAPSAPSAPAPAPNPPVAPLEVLRARFATIPDLRQAGRVRHRLDGVLMIAFCSMLSDNDAFTDMEAFAKTQLPWLRTFLSLPHGPPSHDVFRNAFIALRPQTMLDILADWCGDLAGRQIKIDGKALRGTATAASKQAMVHILRAWVHEAGISAGHVVCREKSNELDALQRLLALLELKGALVSIDAMGTYPAITEQIHDAGGDCLLALKANQKEALQAVEARFAQLDAGTGFDPAAWAAGILPGALLAPGSGPLAPGQSVALSHGRHEQRLCTVLDDLEFFHKSWKWAGLKTVIRLIRTTCRGPKRGELSVEIHYYLSSLAADEERLAAHIRAHWGVESFHHVLDLTFGEVIVRSASAPPPQSLHSQRLRNHLPKQTICAKRKRAALDPGFRTELPASISPNFGA